MWIWIDSSTLIILYALVFNNSCDVALKHYQTTLVYPSLLIKGFQTIPRAQWGCCGLGDLKHNKQTNFLNRYICDRGYSHTFGCKVTRSHRGRLISLSTCDVLLDPCPTRLKTNKIHLQKTFTYLTTFV
jgi:hypothetical protein